MLPVCLICLLISVQTLGTFQPASSFYNFTQQVLWQLTLKTSSLLLSAFYGTIHGGFLHQLWLWTGAVIPKLITVSCWGLPDIIPTIPVGWVTRGASPSVWDHQSQVIMMNSMQPHGELYYSVYNNSVREFWQHVLHDHDHLRILCTSPYLVFYVNLARYLGWAYFIFSQLFFFLAILFCNLLCSIFYSKFLYLLKVYLM